MYLYYEELFRLDLMRRWRTTKDEKKPFTFSRDSASFHSSRTNQFVPACRTLPNLSSGMQQTLLVEEVLGGVAPGKNPVKCLVEVVKDANSFFAQGFAKHDKHSG
jgi:hypothetical protein